MITRACVAVMMIEVGCRPVGAMCDVARQSCRSRACATTNGVSSIYPSLSPIGLEREALCEPLHGRILHVANEADQSGDLAGRNMQQEERRRSGRLQHVPNCLVVVTFPS